MARPTFISAVACTQGGSATPGAITIPGGVPSDAEGAILFFSGYALSSPNLASLTSNFAGTWTIENLPLDGDSDYVGAAYARVTSYPGSETYTPVFDTAFLAGPGAIIVFYKDIPPTGSWINDVALAQGNGDPSTATPTANTTADCDVVFFDSQEFTGIPATISGWTSRVTQSQADINSRLSTLTGTAGSPTTTQSGNGTFFPTAAMVAVLGITGGAGVTVDLSVTDTADTLAGTAGVVVGVALAVTDAADVVSATATLPISVNLSRTDAADTLVSTATLPIVANLSVTDASDTLSAAATVQVVANLSVTDEADALESTVVVGDAPIEVNLAVTDAADTVSATATVAVSVALSVTDASDTLAATSTMPVTVNAGVSDAADTLSATVGAVVEVDLSVTDEADTLAATATVQQEGEISVALEVVDESDSLEATAILGPAPQPSGSGGRNWLIDVPVDARVVKLSVLDDDDTLQATAAVKWSSAKVRKLMAQHAKQLAPRGRKVHAEVVDDDDTLACMASVRWPPAKLIRSVALTRAGMR